MFFYSWAYQLDICLLTVFFMFNVQMFNIEKKKNVSADISYKLDFVGLYLDAPLSNIWHDMNFKCDGHVF